MEAGDNMRKLAEIMPRQIAIAAKEWLTSVQTEARLVHRFTTRTGALERSIQTKVTERAEDGKVYLETGIARYGPYIHNGFKSWKPDMFLTDAAERKRKELPGMISRAIANSIRRVTR